MPEQIEPAALDQVLPREAHNFANLFTVTRLVAMHGAVLADRLVRQRAAQTTFKGIQEEFTALFTDRILVQRQSLQLGYISGHNSAIGTMPVGTKNRGKLQKDLEVLDLFTRQV